MPRPRPTLPRPTLRWVNTAILEGTVRGDPPAIAAAERILRSGPGRDKRRFTMLIRQGFKEARVAIKQHARRPHYALNVLTYLMAESDESGYLAFEPDQLARDIGIHCVSLYGCLIDLEREPIGVLVRAKRRGRLNGVQLTEKVFEQPTPRPRPRKRGRQAPAERRAA